MSPTSNWQHTGSLYFSFHVYIVLRMPVKTSGVGLEEPPQTALGGCWRSWREKIAWLLVYQTFILCGWTHICLSL